jgi:hypothetical protein
VQVARVDLEARRIEFRLVRSQDRGSLLGPDPAKGKAARRSGESVEQRQARRAAGGARHGRDIDKRETARGGKKAVGAEGTPRARRRGRA